MYYIHIDNFILIDMEGSVLFAELKKPDIKLNSNYVGRCIQKTPPGTKLIFQYRLEFSY